MDSKELKEIKKIANEIKPQFNLGKQGITETFLETIDNYINAHQIVKVKVLSATDKEGVKEIAEEVAEKTDSELIDRKGFTFTLYRE